MSLSWGNWDVRVYAAEAWVSLAPRFAGERPEIIDMLEKMVTDPVPQVRLQIAQNLQVLSVAAPERMWEMANRIAAEEPHDAVLASFLNHVVHRFCWPDLEKCEALIEGVRARMPFEPADPKRSRDSIGQALGGLTAQLWVAQDRPKARGWLLEWATDPDVHGELLTAFLSNLRGIFFERYSETADDHARAMTDRAQEGVTAILEQCIAISSTGAVIYMDNASAAKDKERAQAAVQAAESVIHHAMNQLYFGSGAHANDLHPALGLSSHDAMRRFLLDYAPALALLNRSVNPATIHHLVKLYEYLIPGEPAVVFDAVHALLIGKGAEEGYQYESLANTAVVRIITRYIADFRSIFEDEGRRGRLLDVLRLFSDVGWSEALKLLYDLPDLLR